MNIENLRRLTDNLAAIKLFMAMNAAGYTVRFIGGCVRDALLDRPIGDIDLATDATPEQIISCLDGFRIIPTGIAHGTVTVIVDGQSFEMTTLRRDVQTDGRHAVVSFANDWATDAQRRDFTINALGLDMSGNIYDYCGGLDDLKKKRLRFIGDPASRITEDYLRILRYFRFAATLNWALDTHDKNACQANASSLGRLSRERVQAELYKLLMSDGCCRIVAIMVELGIFTAIARSVYYPKALERLIDVENKYALGDAFRRLIVLTGHTNIAFFETFLVLNNSQKRRLQQLARLDGAMRLTLSERLYRFGTAAVVDRALCDLDESTLATALAWVQPVFPLAAKDVLKLAGGPGPRVGQLLRSAEDYWVDHQFKPTKDVLLNFISV